VFVSNSVINGMQRMTPAHNLRLDLRNSGESFVPREMFGESLTLVTGGHVRRESFTPTTPVYYFNLDPLPTGKFRSTD